ncbi:hypothetical protein MMC28_006100 [Mycoblastus sanguinarius]|nr:hypothetical protein [Mycoblastus sanguinarius]
MESSPVAYVDSLPLRYSVPFNSMFLQLATIVEIIDHKRALVDGPSKKEDAAVPRQSVGLNNLIVCLVGQGEAQSRFDGQTYLDALHELMHKQRAWEKAEVEKQWDESSWAKRREQRARRRNLSDFDRFKVLKLKKQVRSTVGRDKAVMTQVLWGTRQTSSLH